MATGGIWISICDDGEGGEFGEAVIADVIAKFYTENF